MNQGRRLSFCVALSLVATVVTAAPVRPGIGHDVWTAKDGMPTDIGGIAQTADGSLWLGASVGLYRFDGMRFELFRPQSGPGLLSNAVFAVFAPPSGGLWIGYRFGGFSFLSHGRVTNYPVEAKFAGTVLNFVQDRHGVVWAAATSGVWKFDGERWQHLGDEMKAPETISCIGLEHGAVLWAVAAHALWYLRPDGQRFESVSNDLRALSGYTDTGVFGLTTDPDGFVVTGPSWLSSGLPKSGGPSEAALLEPYSVAIVDRAAGLWIAFGRLAHLWSQGSVREVLQEARFEETNRTPDGNFDTKLVSSRSPVQQYDIQIYTLAKLVDREGNV